MKRRTKYHVHSIQTKYVLLTFALLMVYTLILALALFIPPSLKLNPSVPLNEQILAGEQFIALSDRLWPAILVAVPVFMVLSLLITHKIAGPVYRLEQSLKQMAAGNLDLRVRFRTGDDLQELANLVNQIIARQSEALTTIQKIRERIHLLLAEAAKDPPAHDPPNRERTDRA